MNDEHELAITWEPVGKAGSGVLVIFHADGVYTDKFDITKKGEREGILEELSAELPGIPVDDVRAQLEDFASRAVRSDGESGGGDSQADLLVALTEGDHVELFHAPGERDNGGYATVDVDGRLETWSLSSMAFKGWLRRGFYQKYGKAVGAQALTDALGLIKAKALFDGEEHPVAVRIAAHDGEIFIDLGSEDRRAVHVTPRGWTVVESKNVPVRFIRRTGMLPLPVPVTGGSVDDLRPLANLPTDELWILFIGTMVAFLLPFGPYAILVIYGEHGSAKSTLAKMLRRLIDPNKAALRRTCKTDEDLMIAASNGWIVAFDNLSDIRPGLADSLCSLATGAAFATRRFFTNEDEVLFEAMRPVMVNGINDLATRADLLDRAVLLDLPAIPDANRQDETELWRAFDEVAPGVLGALLGAVSSVLRNRGSVHLSEKPRMADFAMAVSAAEEGLGWEPGAFMAAYSTNRADANRHAIESVAVGRAIERLMEANDTWSGTASDLLVALSELVDEKARGQGWPKAGRGMSGALKRIAPNLRAIGIDVQQGVREPGGSRQRLVHLRRQMKGEQVHGRDGSSTSSPNRPAQNAVSSPSEGFRDGRDGRDGLVPNSNDDPHSDSPGSSDRATFEARERDPDVEVGTQPSRPSQPSRTGSGAPEGGVLPGRLRDGSADSGTVGRESELDERDWGWAQ